MDVRKLLLIVTLLITGGVSASYMSECEALIGEWKKCGGDSGNCTNIEKQIEASCKCHVKKGNSWNLVNTNLMGAGESNVCGLIPEDTTIPPDEDPPRKNIDRNPPNPGNGGGRGDKGRH